MSNLDQLVKGAPPPGAQYNVPSTSPITAADAPSSLPDPLAALPSSPPQIYLNLLILEASLRAQWLQLRARRRQHTFFLSLLGLWIMYFAWALFLAPKEVESSFGSSVSWVIEVAQKVSLMGGIVTGILVWATGRWERGVRWPRRWMGTTNRGLRVFNCKMVLIRKSWWREFFDIIFYLSCHGIFPSSSSSSYRFVDHDVAVEDEKPPAAGGKNPLPDIREAVERAGYMEDLAAGGDYVKLLLLPKPFSAAFRENWDVYRNEYWEKENERRAVMLKKLRQQDKDIARQEGGWLWWTGYRGRRKVTPTIDVEKTHHLHVQRHGSEKDARRIRRDSMRSSSHSRNSSRSTTPTLELEDSGLARHSSTASTASERRRKKPSSGSRGKNLAPGSIRSVTPEVHSPLVRENSFTSVSSLDSERPAVAAAGGGDADSVRSLKASAKPGGSISRKPGSERAPRGG